MSDRSAKVSDRSTKVSDRSAKVSDRSAKVRPTNTCRPSHEKWDADFPDISESHEHVESGKTVGSSIVALSILKIFKIERATFCERLAQVEQ